MEIRPSSVCDSPSTNFGNEISTSPHEILASLRVNDDCGESKNSPDFKTTKYQQHVLPPCKVCGTQATGFHYGINSCEACKGFFRRSIIRKKDYRCSKSSKCLLKPGKHKLCPYCRFKRCLAVGMSVKGIKTGRYTYAKRTKDIMELKMIDNEIPVTSTSSEECEIKLLMNEARELRILADRLLDDMQAFSGDSQEIEQKQKQYVRDPNYTYDGLDGESLEMAGTCLTSSPEMGEPSPGSNKSDEECLNVTLKETEQFIINSNQTKSRRNTGAQPSTDDDRKDIKLAWFKTIEFGIRCLVRFIKAVPGFRNLHMDDQLNLIKHSFLEAWLIGRHKAFNTVKRVYTAANGFTLDIGLTCTRDMFHIVLRNVKRIQALGLNAEETYILQAVVQLFPDRCEMRNYKQIEKLQNHYLNILQCLLKVSHKDDNFILPKIISVLTELRDVTDVFYKTSSQTAGHLPLIKDSAPLLMEMVTTVHE